MRDETVSRTYAETLFALAERHEGHQAYGEALASVTALLNENPAFQNFLDTPRISAANKKRVLRKAFEGEVPQEFLNFLLVLVDKRRQRLLREIARHYFALEDEHLGRVHVEVTLARKPGEGDMDAISARLSQMLGKTAVPHLRVDPAILGGIVVQTGDTVFDGSLRRGMASMRRRLLTASLPSA